MLDLKPIPSLAELQALRGNYPSDEWIDIEETMRPLVRMQEWPDLTLHSLTGIYIPPHQRWMLYQMHRGAPSNVVVASRGTAKTSTICGLYVTYVNVVFPKRQSVTLAMTGFRGGQRIFKDIERWLTGGWFDQSQETPFFLASIEKGNRLGPVSKASNQWSIEFKSKTSNTTVPTNSPENILGFRAQDLWVDEAKLLEKEVIDNVAIPFLNVGDDFKHGGRLSSTNRVTYCTTVDFTWRPFQERAEAAYEGLKRELRALRAMRDGNWDLYERLDVKGLHEHSWTRFDYTDLFVPREVTARNGDRFELSWPNPDIELTHDKRGIPFTHYDPEEGRVVKFGPPVDYYQTYPSQKDNLERGIRDGTADEASWKSEQRNILDTAIGDVYSNKIVDDATCAGDRWIIPFRKMPEAWQRKHDEEETGYFGPVLWKCDDPCVLGVDYAPLSDFCAFVVIRIGPLGKGVFDPFTHQGKTQWSNVVWAEQHQRLTARQMAEKIRQLWDRYNLAEAWHDDTTYYKDDALVCRAMGIDMRHGGTSIREELAFINDAEAPLGPDGKTRLRRFYDPNDKDEKYRQLRVDDPDALPVIDGIWSGDQLNDQLVSFTIAQMEQGMLYLPRYLEYSERPIGKAEIHYGYEAARSLERQLRKLRQEPTQNFRRFYMDGDTKQVQNKKDLWAAFIYGAKELRGHLIRQRQLDNVVPPIAALATTIGKNKGRFHGTATGARRGR